MFGDATLAMRAFDLVWQVATAVLVYEVAAYWYASSTAILAGVLYALFYMDTNFWSMAQADSFLNLPTLLAVLGWRRFAKDGRARYAMVAGIGLGAAILLRPTAVTTVLLYPLLGRVCRGNDPAASHDVGMFKAFAFMVLGLLVAFASTIWYFTWHGAWEDFRITWFHLNPFYVKEMTYPSISDGLHQAFLQIRNTQWYDTRLELAIIILGPLYALTRLRQDKGAVVTIGFLGTALLGIALQKRWYVYQWSPAYPPLAILGAALVEIRHVYKDLPVPRRRRLSFGYGLLAAVLALSCLSIQARNHYEFYTYLGGWRDSKAYHRYFVGEGFSYPYESAAAGYVKARTRPGDRLAIWGMSPLIYYLADRQAPSRLFLNHILLWPATPEQWKREYFDSLRRHPPPFFLIRRGDIMTLLTGRYDDSLAQVRAIPELRASVENNYRFDRRIGYFEVYKRVRPLEVPSSSLSSS